MRRTAISLLLTLFVLPAVLAGDLEPSDPPGPTMKTMDQLPPVWSQVLPADDGPDVCHSSRFLCVMNDEAVLDRETGLVWQRSPITDVMDWYAAVTHCYTLANGGRRGWRLPGQAELSSLVDYTVSDPSLPAGHPFQDIQSNRYWSANTLPGHNSSLDHAWLVDFDAGGSGWYFSKTSTSYVMCVRGGTGIDVQSSR